MTGPPGQPSYPASASDPRDHPSAGGFTRENCLGGTPAPGYRQWEFDLVAPYLGRSVLEVGSGMGYFSQRLAQASFDRLVLSDTEEYCLQRLRDTYAGSETVEVATVGLPGRIDIGEPVESVVAMNVLEHIEDDVQALRDLVAAVVPGGRIVLWVPAYMQLYGAFDRKVGHFRRYTPRTLRSVVERAGLRVLMVRPVNLLGGIAWFVQMRLRDAGHLEPRLVGLYDRVIVPLSRGLESVVRPPFGQSVLCAAQTPAA
ncbi:MAG: class I SAM-dependent methyltransferase [Actinomycetota bacterium]|nr:class I SAM-dependent methyltransferase [Actinomycetota bacterium]